MHYILICTDSLDPINYFIHSNSKMILGNKNSQQNVFTGLTIYYYFFKFQDSLGDMFELDKISVHAIVAKMIISEELMASMDEPTECMVMHRTEPSSKTFLLFLFPPKI